MNPKIAVLGSSCAYNLLIHGILHDSITFRMVECVSGEITLSVRWNSCRNRKSSSVDAMLTCYKGNVLLNGTNRPLDS